jgi:murein DD-endopeptidase MepM/ murein hydrolase activator NlpD
VVADPLLATGAPQPQTSPGGAQQPSLLHFSPDSLTMGRAVAGVVQQARLGSSGPVTIQPRTVGLLLLLLASVVAGVVALMTRTRWRRLRKQLVAASVVAAVPLTLAGIAMIALPQARPLPATAPLATTAPLAPQSRQAEVNAASASPAWTTLLAIEDSITQQHAQLVSNEQHLAALNTTLSGLGGPSSAPARALEPSPPGSPTGAFTTVINQHQLLASEYQQSLQSEYQFFRAAMQQPAELAALQAATAHAPRAVQTAVAYDISVVRTQAAQEAAIQAAVANAATPTPPSPPKGRVGFHAPVGGVVTQAFGPTTLALEPPVTYNGVFSQHFHTGLDIAAPLDTPVGAAANGVVVLAASSRDATGNLVGYGNYVVIKHADGYETVYAHLDQILATVGEQVRQGQVIGLLGSTGWSTGPHVHFEIRLNGTYVDPAPFLAAQLRP